MVHIPFIEFLMLITGRRHRILKTWDCSDIMRINKTKSIITCPYCESSHSEFVHRGFIGKPDHIGLYDENKQRINYIYGNDLPLYIPRRIRKAIVKKSLELLCGRFYVDYRRCLSCDLIFQNFPHTSEGKKFYYQVLYRINKEVEDSTGSEVFGRADLPVFVKTKEAIPRYFLEVTRLSRGTKILDVGCAEGLVCRYLSEKGFDSHGIDPAASMVNYAHKVLHLDNMVCGDYTEERYPHQYFDGIISHHVLEHIVDIDAFFSALSCHVKTGGFLLIQVPCVDSIRVPEEYGEIFAPHYCDHIRGYSEKFLRKIHRTYHFDIIECKKTPCDVSQLPSSDRDRVLKIPVWGDQRCSISILSKKGSS